LSGWVQRRVSPSELLTAYYFNVDAQTHSDKAWRDTFLSTLLGPPPVFVLRLLVDSLVPLWDTKTPSFRGGAQLGTEFGLDGSKNMKGIVEIVTPSPSLVENFTPSPSIDICDEAQVDTPSLMSTIDLCDEAQVDTGKGNLNNGTSDGTVARR
jgi:hypothetical protein